MLLQKIELCVGIAGPKSKDQPLEKIEKFALKRINPGILAAVEAGSLQRMIDYKGNYFLVFSTAEKAQSCQKTEN